MSRLRMIDRAADARVRIYADELRLLLTAAKSMGLSAVPVESLEALLDRMQDREPQSLRATPPTLRVVE
jgi:hypothetical protein